MALGCVGWGVGMDIGVVCDGVAERGRVTGSRLNDTVKGAVDIAPGVDDVPGAVTGVNGRKLVGRDCGTGGGGGGGSVTGTTLTNENPGNDRAGAVLCGGGGGDAGRCCAVPSGHSGRKLNDVKCDGELGNRVCWACDGGGGLLGTSFCSNGTTPMCTLPPTMRCLCSLGDMSTSSSSW